MFLVLRVRSDPGEGGGTGVIVRKDGKLFGDSDDEHGNGIEGNRLERDSSRRWLLTLLIRACPQEGCLFRLFSRNLFGLMEGCSSPPSGESPFQVIRPHRLCRPVRADAGIPIGARERPGGVIRVTLVGVIKGCGRGEKKVFVAVLV
jgi:hypothetical protein